jgi:ubiquinone/menaquinone biosynthesis C-methylase UbiE
MMFNMKSREFEIQLQRRYYAETASRYNSLHGNESGAHFFALHFMTAVLDHLQIKTILDVGSGTGRVLLYLKKIRPDIRIVGIEPVKELRDIGYADGLSKTELIDGDATKIQFFDCEFDLVCEFGVLHHIRKPQVAVSEMLRAARKAIFISDSNNFGQGSLVRRTIKQLVNMVGLWAAVDFLKTKGKGYTFSDGDGIAYSYSVFNNYRQIQESCTSIHILNTQDGDIDPYRTASHIALLGVKKQEYGA